MKRAVGAAALAAVVAGFVGSRMGPGLPGSVPPDPRRPAVADAPEARAPEAVHSLAAAPGPAAVPVQVRAASAPAGVWDLCGLGRVAQPLHTAPGAMLPGPIGDQAFAGLQQRTAAALQAGDATSQVAALVFMHDADTDVARRAAAVAQALHATDQAPEAAALAWAAAFCNAGRGGTCGVAVRAWTAREPDNAAAWALLAAVEPTAADEAARGLRGALYWRTHAGRLAALATAAVPADAPPYLRLAVAMRAHVSETGVAVQALQGLFIACRAQATACTPLPHVLLETADTALVWSHGLERAERARWPEEQLAPWRALKAQREAGPPPLDPEQPFGCASVERGLPWFTDALPASADAAARLRSLR